MYIAEGAGRGTEYQEFKIWKCGDLIKKEISLLMLKR